MKINDHPRYISAKFGLIFSSVTLAMGRCLEINTLVEYGDVNLCQ